ncbi:hypothetical protein ABPG72_020073 [Tetrahymena utriculariae]
MNYETNYIIKSKCKKGLYKGLESGLEKKIGSEQNYLRFQTQFVVEDIFNPMTMPLSSQLIGVLLYGFMFDLKNEKNCQPSSRKQWFCCDNILLHQVKLIDKKSNSCVARSKTAFLQTNHLPTTFPHTGKRNSSIKNKYDNYNNSGSQTPKEQGQNTPAKLRDEMWKKECRFWNQKKCERNDCKYQHFSMKNFPH